MSDLLTETEREQDEIDIAQVNLFMKPAESTEKPPVVMLAERLAKLEHDLESALQRIQALENHE